MNCLNQPGKCLKKGVVYQFTCLNCLSLGKEMKYYGESYRSSFDRGSEHKTAIKNKNRESPLLEHHEDEHGAMEPSFSMKVVGTFRKLLQRQTYEGLLIGSSKEGTLMNRRGNGGKIYPQN